MMLLLVVILQFVGSSFSRLQSRIVSGQTAPETNFPYAAYLNIQCISYTRHSSISWRCGASIVNQYVLLTAGHCVDPVTCDDIAITVTVGHPDGLKGIVSTAVSYLLHEDYTPDFVADLALVKLQNPLKFNAKVSRVALMENPPYEEEGVVSGWGRVQPSLNILTKPLKFATLYVWKQKACLDLLEEQRPGTFCASSNYTGYVLNGDSGSALVVRGYIQTGICSYFKPRVSQTVAVFTDVGYHYEWIEKNVKTIMCEKK